VLHAQAADDEIQIFVPGASERESSVDGAAAVFDVTSNFTPDVGANDDVVFHSNTDTELHKSPKPSLNVSITPIATAASCNEGDSFSQDETFTLTSAAPTGYPEMAGDEYACVANGAGDPKATTDDFKAKSQDVETNANEDRKANALDGEAGALDVKASAEGSDTISDVKCAVSPEVFNAEAKAVATSEEPIIGDELARNDDHFLPASEGESVCVFVIALKV